MSSAKVKHVWRTMVSKYENHNAELQKKETELRHRLQVIECCLPALLVRHTENDVSAILNQIPGLKNVSLPLKSQASKRVLKETCTNTEESFVGGEDGTDSLASFAVSTTKSNCSLDPTSRKECVEKLQKMVRREQKMLSKIKEMKRCEEDYKRRLGELAEQDQDVENTTSIPIENMNEYLGRENSRLAAELQDLKVDLRKCIHNVQDPLAFQLDREEKLTQAIGIEIIEKAKATVENPESVLEPNVVLLHTTLMSTCESMSTLKEDNEGLKRDISFIKSKIAKLQKDFLQHSASRDFTLKMYREIGTGSKSVLPLKKQSRKQKEKTSFEYAPIKKLKYLKNKKAKAQKVSESPPITESSHKVSCEVKSSKPSSSQLVHVSEEKPWGNVLTTTLSDGGAMQVVSEAPSGNIKTVVTCSPSGMIEINTELTLQDREMKAHSSTTLTTRIRESDLRQSRSESWLASTESPLASVIDVSSQTDKQEVCDGSTSIQDNLISVQTKLEEIEKRDIAIGEDNKRIHLSASMGDTAVVGSETGNAVAIPVKKKSNVVCSGDEAECVYATKWKDGLKDWIGGPVDTTTLKWNFRECANRFEMLNARHTSTTDHETSTPKPNLRVVKSEQKPSTINAKRHHTDTLITELVQPKFVQQNFICARCTISQAACLPDCDCLECLCDPCPNPPKQHPPDCDCAQCICDPCSAPKQHPDNCDCLECLCKPCATSEAPKEPQKISKCCSVMPAHAPTCKCYECRCKSCGDPRKRPAVNACECETETVSQFCSCSPPPRYPGDCGCTLCPLGQPLDRDPCNCPDDACICDPCGDPRHNRDIKVIKFECDGCGRTCDCSPCRCQTCPDPSVTVHPPDCDCINCICDNCPDIRIHPENCNCSKCECDECPDQSHLNIITEFLKQIQCSCQHVDNCFQKIKPDRCGVKDMIILAMSKELKLKVGGNVLSNLLINLFSDPKVLDMLSEPEGSELEGSKESMDRVAQVKDKVAKILAKPNRCEELMKDWQEYIASTRKDVATSAYNMAGDVIVSSKEEPVRDREKKAAEGCPCGCSDTKPDDITSISELYKRSSSKRTKSCCQEKKTKSRHTKKSSIRTTCQPKPCDRIPTPTTSRGIQMLSRCIKCEPSHYSKGPKINLSPMDFEDMRRLEDNTILVKWKRPANQSVIGYELMVNNKLMYRVRNATRTSAILYGLNIEDCLKFTLYALSNEGRCNPPVAAIFQP